MTLTDIFEYAYYWYDFGEFFLAMDVIIKAVGILLLVAAIAMDLYLKMLTGRKLGVDKRRDWQAYVPFVTDYYRTRMTGERVWKMFFFGSTQTVISLLLAVVTLAVPGGWRYVIFVFLAVYTVASLVIRIKHFGKIYEKFGYRKSVALMRYLPIANAAVFVIDVIVAVDSRVSADGGRSDDGKSGSPATGQDRPVANITCVAGPYRGQSFPVPDGQEITLGRNPAMNNLVFDQYQVHVGRRHCAIRFDKNDPITPYIVTCYTKNGVLYDNNKIVAENETKKLPRGTTISLGSAENKFVLN